MKLATSPALDALCGEYLLGTLRGPARRRFERSLQQEPLVASRFAHWQRLFAPRYSAIMEIQPAPSGWKRLEHTLQLGRYRMPWYQRAGFWRGWAATATAALVIGFALQVWKPDGDTPNPVAIAELASKAGSARVYAHLSKDGRSLILHAERPVLAGAAQSYELWLLPADGRPPISMAVLGTLDAHIALPAVHQATLKAGGKLAVSVEPAGGSPDRGPSGAIILTGDLKI